MDYRKMILMLLDRIQDEQTLKKIFEYVHREYIKK